MKNLVIFDLDGTLALIEHRRHFVEKCTVCDGKGVLMERYASHEGEVCLNCDGKPHKPDWRAFFAACIDDAPNEPVIKVLHSLLETNHEIWIVSGRSDEVRQSTLIWLDMHEVSYYKIIMRKEGDRRADDVVKREWLSDGTIPKDRVAMVFDDRQRVVDMWRAEGLTCLQVAPGDF